MKNYWFNSAPSGTFIQLIGLHGMDALRGYGMTSEALFAPITASQFKNNWQQMSFQAGYTTIQQVEVNPVDEYDYNLVLGPPNQEVTCVCKPNPNPHLP